MLAVAEELFLLRGVDFDHGRQRDRRHHPDTRQLDPLE
jgi:hypothetical protein